MWSTKLKHYLSQKHASNEMLNLSNNSIAASDQSLEKLFVTIGYTCTKVEI